MGLLFILFAMIANEGFAQTGTCADPIVIDLTGHPDTSFRRQGDIRSGKCCAVSGPSTTCVSYLIILDPATDVLSITLPSTGKKSSSEGYYVNCNGPTGGYSLGTPVCVSDHSIPYVITYCKPGGDPSVDLVFNLTRGFSVSPDIYLRKGCTGTMSVSHLIAGTIKWTSGNPTYDSYLSSTTDSTVTVTPPAVPPASGYVDYTVTGTEQSPCNHTLKTGVVRAWLYPKLAVAINTSGASVCSGNPVTLTAVPSGGNPAYSYLWSNGATTPSITVNTAGTYTVQVNDQLSTCGAVLQSITLPATQLPGPTASGQSICIGNATTLTATAPGGPYQWYDPSGNPVGDGISASYTTPAFMASGTYNYSVTTSFGGCPSQKTTVPVTVLPTSPAPTAPPVTVCTGNQATLTATAPGAPYQWYDPSGNPVGNGSASYTAPLLPAGTYNYTVVSSVTGCSGQKTTVPVTVLPTPPGPTAPPVTVCSGNQATLTATAPGGPYQWYDPSGNPVGDGISASYTAPLLPAGSYSYKVISSFGGCPSAPTTVMLTVLPTPVAPTVAPVTICNNNPATLTATAPGGPYQWYDPSGNPVGDGISASYTTPVLTAGTYNYKVITSLGGCPSKSTTVTVTVLPTPPGPTAPPVTVCSGNQATLTATAPGGPYQWYDPAGNKVGDGISASYTAPLLPAGSYSYKVISSFGGCPSAPTTVTLTVLPTPPGPTAPPVTVCSGNQATLTATAPGGPYQWYDPAGNKVGDGISASYTAPLLAAGTYNYKVISSFGGCPSAPTTVTLTVLPTPPGPTAPPVTVCSGNQATLTATAPGGPYQWYDPAGNKVGDGISASYTAPLLPAGTYNYKVISSFGGCPSAPTTVTLTVLSTPPPPTAPPATICSGNQATLTATAPGGPYQWYDPAGNKVGDGISASYTVPLLPAGSYSYKVISSFGGCPSAPTTVTLTVLPTPPGPTAPPVTVCSGNQATLTATAPGGPYQWYDPAGNKVGDGISASYTAPLLPAGTYNYKVISSFGGCPSAPTTVTLTVLPTPPPPTAPPATICTGTTATLTATAPGGPYQWYDPSGNPVGDGTSASYTTPVLTTGAGNTIYNYTVKTSFGGCPSAPATVPVTVTPLPPTPTVQSQ